MVRQGDQLINQSDRDQRVIVHIAAELFDVCQYC